MKTQYWLYLALPLSSIDSSQPVHWSRGRIVPERWRHRLYLFYCESCTSVSVFVCGQGPPGRHVGGMLCCGSDMSWTPIFLKTVVSGIIKYTSQNTRFAKNADIRIFSFPHSNFFHIKLAYTSTMAAFFYASLMTLCDLISFREASSCHLSVVKVTRT